MTVNRIALSLKADGAGIAAVAELDRRLGEAKILALQTGRRPPSRESLLAAMLAAPAPWEVIIRRVVFGG